MNNRSGLIATLALIAGCGSVVEGPADAGEIPSCFVGHVCHVIDECGCVPHEPSCTYYDCVADDGTPVRPTKPGAPTVGTCQILPFEAGTPCRFDDVGKVCNSESVCVWPRVD